MSTTVICVHRERLLTWRHPGDTVGDVQAATGWDLGVAGDVAFTPPPAVAEPAALRALTAGGQG